MNKKEEASKCYKQGLSLKADHDDIGLVHRAGALLALNKLEKALDNYNEATKKSPNNAIALFNRGKILKILGKKEEALEAYNEVISICPNHPEAYIIDYK